MYFIDTQVVTYIFRITRLGRMASGAQDYPAKEASPRASRRAPRDLLLHHHRMAKLAFRETSLLVHPGGDNRVVHRL